MYRKYYVCVCVCIGEHGNEIDTLSIVTNAIDGFSHFNESPVADNVLMIKKH